MTSRPMSLDDDSGTVCRVSDVYAFGFNEACTFLNERPPDARNEIWLDCLMPDLNIRCYKRQHLEVLIPCKG